MYIQKAQGSPARFHLGSDYRAHQGDCHQGKQVVQLRLQPQSVAWLS